MKAVILHEPICPDCKSVMEMDGPLGKCPICPETVAIIDPGYELPYKNYLDATDQDWEGMWQLLGSKRQAVFEPEIDLSEWLVRTSLCESKTQGRTLIRQGAIRINGCIEDHDLCLNHNEMIRGKWILLKKGKKHNFGLIRVVDAGNAPGTSAQPAALP